MKNYLNSVLEGIHFLFLANTSDNRNARLLNN